MCVASGSLSVAHMLMSHAHTYMHADTHAFMLTSEIAHHGGCELSVLSESEGPCDEPPERQKEQISALLVLCCSS